MKIHCEKPVARTEQESGQSTPRKTGLCQSRYQTHFFTLLSQNNNYNQKKVYRKGLLESSKMGYMVRLNVSLFFILLPEGWGGEDWPRTCPKSGQMQPIDLCWYFSKISTEPLVLFLSRQVSNFCIEGERGQRMNVRSYLHQHTGKKHECDQRECRVSLGLPGPLIPERLLDKEGAPVAQIES